MNRSRKKRRMMEWEREGKLIKSRTKIKSNEGMRKVRL